MSTLTVQNIQGSSSSGNTISVASGHVLHATGHVLQVKQALFRGNEYHNTSSYTDVTDLSINITPSSIIHSKFCLKITPSTRNIFEIFD